MIENIKAILRHADEFDWSLQGFGMFRTYFAEEFRIHLWDRRFAAPGVSTIHTHPWHFKATVLGGSIRNVIYRMEPVGARSARFDSESIDTESFAPPPSIPRATHHMQKILCGPGGGLVDGPQNVVLRIPDAGGGVYPAGTAYHQQASVLHETIPEDGTVTAVSRNFLHDTEHAMVCWPLGTEWGTAEPRAATKDEIRTAAAYALERWFA